ncbi:STAS domain-containing protein [Rhodococcoides kyotonense]|uniref:Anti-anti-sigma factor n=1 Tax=Rhodococcoides kyotonense TaxID=398843 RepID=A0A239ET58_9NOCA|nr:STAS domain-containing protein [Rhodococcus kyotonensis]SNS47458.1 anti-anti-sigma factor [Rhodococcus kyotonensis]
MTTATVVFHDDLVDVSDATRRYGIDVEKYSPAYTVLRLRGEFDMTTLAELTDTLADLAAGDAATDVDLSGVTFLYSGAANALIDAAHDSHGRLRLFAPNRAVEVVFTALGAAQLLSVPTFASAWQSHAA